MILTDDEKRMADGERGQAVRLAMEILTEIGSNYGAERLIEIKSVHSAAIYPQLEVSPEILEMFVEKGGHFVVPTTLNPSHAPLNFDKWKEFPEPEDFRSRGHRMVNAMEKLGVIPTYSCTPYFQGNLPRIGQHISWVESSAISFANSVIGARTNRTTMGVELAAAVTGRTPEFGLHLDENRSGNVLVKIEFEPKTLKDFHTIGYIIGKYFGDKVPVIEGLPKGTTANQLKCLGAAAASRGVVALYHAVGITPEAQTKEQAFKGKRPQEEIKIDERAMKKTEEEISTYKGGDIDAVLVGCPHPLIEEVKELAALLKDRAVKDSVKFCLFISNDILKRARQMGFIDPIEKAGVDIFEGDCAIWCPLTYWGWKNVATNSAKYANILPSDPTYVDVLYADTNQCVELGTS